VPRGLALTYDTCASHQSWTWRFNWYAFAWKRTNCISAFYRTKLWFLWHNLQMCLNFKTNRIFNRRAKKWLF
jgi:hypothetical protein